MMRCNLNKETDFLDRFVNFDPFLRERWLGVLGGVWEIDRHPEHGFRLEFELFTVAKSVLRAEVS